MQPTPKEVEAAKAELINEAVKKVLSVRRTGSRPRRRRVRGRGLQLRLLGWSCELVGVPDV
jgi:hypothetical protein